ncbi:hypothetical protein V1227_07375 [Lentzea sp. DG1S-22]|uniref:hypothetical protein n=1 Tax=Lentzea sp. DG1S-22 TaxID=3108822 RepID=UPI002E768F3A|nr:hypothetical protein [Lentzea sp. DG1S-22]WVH82567.1 hypothetical protein V1227_07375 [Lentzea sp. DG1S-22]
MLFGRRTWEDFTAVGASATGGNPFTAHRNAAVTYVVSPEPAVGLVPPLTRAAARGCSRGRRR